MKKIGLVQAIVIGLAVGVLGILSVVPERVSAGSYEDGIKEGQRRGAQAAQEENEVTQEPAEESSGGSCG
ncbi:MAG: hypothetical protein WC728_08590 [Elusimicrobiota bacterium]